MAERQGLWTRPCHIDSIQQEVPGRVHRGLGRREPPSQNAAEGRLDERWRVGDPCFACSRRLGPTALPHSSSRGAIGAPQTWARHPACGTRQLGTLGGLIQVPKLGSPLQGNGDSCTSWGCGGGGARDKALHRGQVPPGKPRIQRPPLVELRAQPPPRIRCASVSFSPRWGQRQH